MFLLIITEVTQSGHKRTFMLFNKIAHLFTQKKERKMAENSNDLTLFANAQLMAALTQKGLSYGERKNRIDAALELGADINTTIKTKSNGAESTPLMWAAQLGDSNIVKYLITKGADVAIVNNQGKTALSYTSNGAIKNEIKKQLNRKLLEVASSKTMPEADKITQVKRLLAAGADIDTTVSEDKFNSAESTPLMWAAQQGNTELAKLLIQRGADVNKENDNGKTAADYAKQSENKETMALIESATKDATLRSEVLEDDSFNIDTYQGEIDATNDSYGSTHLMHAAQKGKSDAVRALLSRDADPTKKNNMGKTALMYAAQQGDENGECLSAILGSQRADVNQRDNSGKTALDYLMANETLNKDRKKVLIEQFNLFGGKTGAVMAQEEENLREAAKEGNVESINAILGQKYKVKGQEKPIYDVNFTDSQYKYTLLHHAAENGQAGAINALISHGANVDAKNVNGQTPMHRAAQLGHTEAVKALLEAKANPNTLDKSGLTPLMYAALSGQTQTATLIAEHDREKINQANNNGNTALMIAVLHGKKETALALITAGANPNLQNKEGKTALDMVPADNKELRDALSQAGCKTSEQLQQDEFDRRVDEKVAALKKASDEEHAALREELDAANKKVKTTEEALEIALQPKTEKVAIIDFEDRDHQKAAAQLNNRVKNVHFGGRTVRSLPKDPALQLLKGLEKSGHLKTDAGGQSNAEIYLNRLILANQMQGKDSPARKALLAMVDSNGNIKTNLSEADIRIIQQGVEDSMKYEGVRTRRGRTTLVEDKTYTARTEEREVSTRADALQHLRGAGEIVPPPGAEPQGKGKGKDRS